MLLHLSPRNTPATPVSFRRNPPTISCAKNTHTRNLSKISQSRDCQVVSAAQRARASKTTRQRVQSSHHRHGDKEKVMNWFSDTGAEGGHAASASFKRGVGGFEFEFLPCGSQLLRSRHPETNNATNLINTARSPVQGLLGLELAHGTKKCRRSNGVINSMLQ